MENKPAKATQSTTQLELSVGSLELLSAWQLAQPGARH